MAAAIIPLATTVIPAVIPIVVKLVEKLFGPKTGSVKLDTASQIVEAIQNGLQNTQAIGDKALTVEQIKTLIDAVVSDFNKKGELQGTATAIDSTVGDVKRALALVGQILDLLAK